MRTKSFVISLFILGCASTNQQELIDKKLSGVWISALSSDEITFVEAFLPQGAYCSIGVLLPSSEVQFSRGTWRLQRTQLIIKDERTLTDTNESGKFVEKRKLTFLDDGSLWFMHDIYRFENMRTPKITATEVCAANTLELANQVFQKLNVDTK
jgi:hypothetical protein